MKKVIILITLMMAWTMSPAQAMYVVDGDIMDWGIDLNASGADLKGYLDSHVPGGSVDYVIEDNADKNSKRFQVGPGYTDVGNHYDAEAVYFDHDDTYAYFAIVTGLSVQETKYPAGDIFFSTASDPFADLSYNFAIDVFSGNVYAVGGMEDVYYNQFGVSTPWRLTRGSNGDVASENTLIGTTDLVYGGLNNTHYVIEGQVPLDWINVDKDVWMHWTMRCGNDYLNLHGTATPEPASLFLLGTGILGLFGLGKRKVIV